MNSIEQLAQIVIRHHGEERLMELVWEVDEPFTREKGLDIFRNLGASEDGAKLLMSCLSIGLAAIMAELDPTLKKTLKTERRK